MEQSSLSQIKLQFNNEVIKMQPFILQAKTQTINSLSKKIKKLKNRHGTDDQKEKHARKVESLVSEIMFIKAVKRNDLSRFAISNVEITDKLMNTPVVSKERAMARVISHKSIKQRFLDLRCKYSSVPTARLLEQDPKKINRKQRKEEFKKMKSNPKTQENILQSDNDLSKSIDNEEDKCSDDEDIERNENTLGLHEKNKKLKRIISTSNFKVKSVQVKDELHSPRLKYASDDSNMKRKRSVSIESSSFESDNSSDDENSKIEFESPKKKMATMKKDQDFIGNVNLMKENSETRHKEIQSNEEHKNSNVNKIKTSKQKELAIKKNLIDSNEMPPDFQVEKRVDSFFMTDVGNNYMTMAIPRPADKVVKDEDGQSLNATKNRKMRRAALFGNKLILTDKHNKKNKFDRNENVNKDRFMNQSYQRSKNGESENSKTNFNDRNLGYKEDISKSYKSNNEEEKLHPSWQAKKQQSTILPFQGNKLVFE